MKVFNDLQTAVMDKVENPVNVKTMKYKTMIFLSKMHIKLLNYHKLHRYSL